MERRQTPNSLFSRPPGRIFWIDLADRAAVLKGWKKHMSTDKQREQTSPQTEQRLRSLIAEHETRLAEIADLVAHVRHEINNPLTGVIGQAQLLLREELSATARRRVETIEQLAGRIRDTVAELRDIQRPHRQEQTAIPEEDADDPPRH
jgi:signal transduction histidine kinase